MQSNVGDKVEIIATWKLPDVLKEISGISYLGNELMACIQDEDGVIFIYNLQNRDIEKQIVFSGKADYEAITIAEETAFVLRSDGTIFEVSDYLSGKPITTEHKTFNKQGLNFEGLAYDKPNNRLLLSLKEGSGKNFRPVYSFDLNTYNVVEDAIIKIAFSDPIFAELGKKPSPKNLRPSEITIHPKTGKIYLLEGIKPKLLILDNEGNPEELHILNRKQFRQAEGLSFGDQRDIYISNKGNGTSPNILKISLN